MTRSKQAHPEKQAAVRSVSWSPNTWLRDYKRGRAAKDASIRSRTAWFLAGAWVGLFTVLAAVAILFGTAQGMSEVAAQGLTGIYDEAALSAAAAARNQVAQAQIIAVAEQLGAATEAEVEKTLGLAELAAKELTNRVDNLAAQFDDEAFADSLVSATSGLTNTVENIVEMTRDRALTAARTRIDTTLEDQYQSLVSLLADHRDAQILQIGLAQRDAGRIANAARFLVAFLIPLTAMLLYRRSVGRRQHQVRLEQELEQQKVVVRTKDEAIANLSHELRTPLTSIYGFAMTMLEQPIASEPVLATELARLIASESAELSRMVDDLLTAAKSDNKDLMFRKEIVDPVVEVEKVLAPWANTFEIHTRVVEGWVTADRLRLRQVLRNLVSNAIKYGAAPIAIIGRIEKNHYVFDVIDHGPGVAPEIQDRLFQRYVHQGQAPLVTGSVGLGLSIAHLLATGMGGTITYRRSKDLTIFELRLPLVSPSDEQVSEDQPLVTAAQL